jgi:hypothetical protein
MVESHPKFYGDRDATTPEKKSRPLPKVLTVRDLRVSVRHPSGEETSHGGATALIDDVERPDPPAQHNDVNTVDVRDGRRWLYGFALPLAHPTAVPRLVLDGDHLRVACTSVGLAGIGAVAFDLHANPARAVVVNTAQQGPCFVFRHVASPPGHVHTAAL